ncbi:RteC domain-containing protein [Olleya namhaensis]|uniref:RteC domain-containing protein n=1 Tax=Olleya namhaensis TaxID=1144750 RepID=UPI0024923137|nr:RteC domain-containing protein [Olleya namhaensis]
MDNKKNTKNDFADKILKNAKISKKRTLSRKDEYLFFKEVTRIDLDDKISETELATLILIKDNANFINIRQEIEYNLLIINSNKTEPYLIDLTTKLNETISLLKKTKHDFLNNKTNGYEYPLSNLSEYIGIKEWSDFIPELLKTRIYFIDKLLKFIIKKSKLYTGKDLITQQNPKVKWNGTNVELIELIKALIENNSLKGQQKDIIESFCTFLNVEIKHPNKTITDIKKRNIDSETLFLDRLKSSLYDYITKENIR